MATVEQLAWALAEVHQQLRDWQRKPSVHPRVMNKCPTFSGRDTEWSEWSFIFESVAAKANLEPAIGSACIGLAEKPLPR